MILYNVTVSIDPSIATEWLQWMRSKHIPDVMETGCFVESRISKLHNEEDNGETYAITYLAPSQEKLDEYRSVHAPLLQEEHSAKYAGKFAAFRSFLSVIEEFK